MRCCFCLFNVFLWNASTGFVSKMSFRICPSEAYRKHIILKTFLTYYDQLNRTEGTENSSAGLVFAFRECSCTHRWPIVIYMNEIIAHACVYVCIVYVHVCAEFECSVNSILFSWSQPHNHRWWFIDFNFPLNYHSCVNIGSELTFILLFDERSLLEKNNWNLNSENLFNFKVIVCSFFTY